ncbi:DUF3899 domain-containing protein [Psychrobacillus sp. FSL H8-0510]|uniref:DUF3899 domain-containing protein n=1 Tax=Psychrobacillus sp. FSL H8-0510 TaxID=2921394 RepID=UPI004046951D
MFLLNFLIISGILLISVIYSYLEHNSFNQLLWIDTLFNFSLILTVIGSIMLVIQGGFFSAIIKSFKMFFQKTNRVERVIEEIEGKKENLSPYKLTFKLTFPFLFSGILLLLFSILFSWNFY